MFHPDEIIDIACPEFRKIKIGICHLKSEVNLTFTRLQSDINIGIRDLQLKTIIAKTISFALAWEEPSR